MYAHVYLFLLMFSMMPVCIRSTQGKRLHTYTHYCTHPHICMYVCMYIANKSMMSAEFLNKFQQVSMVIETLGHLHHAAFRPQGATGECSMHLCTLSFLVP